MWALLEASEERADSLSAPAGDNAGMADEGLTLVGPTLVLRVPGHDDVEPLWHAARQSMAELGRWMAWFHDGYSTSDVESWVETTRRGWQTDDDFNLVITARGAGAVLGACGLNKVDRANRLASLGYWVRTESAGRGVATEAAALVAHWGLGILGLNRLEIVVATGNAPSLRVADKLGAVREGVARNRFWLHGRAHDGVVFSLVAADLGLSPTIGDGGRDEGVPYLA